MITRLKFNIESLVNEILNRVPESVWSSSDSLFLDPAMGGGQFVREIENRLRLYGHSDKNISGRVYGCENSKLRVQYAVNKHKLIGKYFAADFLETDFEDMKFNILGNPPFQSVDSTGKRKDQASNLWSQFWKKSFEISDDNSVISLVTPTSWLSPSADFKNSADYIMGHNRLWDVFDNYSSYSDVITVKNHFPSVGSTFGYVVVDRSSNNGLTFSDGASTELGFRPNSNHDVVVKELNLTDNLEKYFSIDQSNTPDIRVSIPMTRTLVADSIEILSGKSSPTQGHKTNDGLYLYVHVNTLSEANSVKNRIIQCLDILNQDCRWSGFLNIRVVKLIRF